MPYTLVEQYQMYEVRIIILDCKLQYLVISSRHIHFGNLANTLRLNLAT